MSKEAALAAAVAAAPQVEATNVEVAPEVSKDDLVSSRIAQIARKESKYREEQEAFKKQLSEFHESKSKFDPFYEKYKQFEEMRAKDPVAAIKLLGFSDTDYVNFVAAQEDKSTPEERAQKIAMAEIEKFKAEQGEKETAATKQRNEETVAQFKKNIGITIKTDAEKYELCNFYGESAENLIYQTVNEAFLEDLKTNPDAEPMTAEAAADLVETYYEEKAAEMRNLKKFNKEKVVEEETPVAKKEEPLKAQVVTPPRPPIKTLTNRVAPTVAATAIKKIETRSEKRERLIAALRATAK